jgi:DNA-directed RNA polymerase specialized sigma subunit
MSNNNQIIDVEVLNKDNATEIVNKSLIVSETLSNLSISELHMKQHKSGKKSLSVTENNKTLKTEEYLSGAKSLKILQVPECSTIIERNNMIKELRKEKHLVKDIALATGLSSSRISQITKKS